jgi:hypothetical protein
MLNEMILKTEFRIQESEFRIENLSPFEGGLRGMLGISIIQNYRHLI